MDQNKATTTTRHAFVLRMTRPSEHADWRYVLISAETKARHVCTDPESVIAILNTIAGEKIAGSNDKSEQSPFQSRLTQ